MMGLAQNLAGIVGSFPFASGFIGQANAGVGVAGAALSLAGDALDKTRTALNTILKAIQTQREQRPGTAAGWFSLQLPDGVRLQNMTVLGRQAGTLQRFQVSLLRQALADPAQTALMALELANAGDPFRVPVNFQDLASGAGLTAVDRVIDNSAYKYLIAGSASGVTGSLAQINAIQVVCQR
jgi:hypothetical protein